MVESKGVGTHVLPPTGYTVIIRMTALYKPHFQSAQQYTLHLQALSPLGSEQKLWNKTKS